MLKTGTTLFELAPRPVNLAGQGLRFNFQCFQSDF